MASGIARFDETVGIMGPSLACCIIIIISKGKHIFLSVMTNVLHLLQFNNQHPTICALTREVGRAFRQVGRVCYDHTFQTGKCRLEIFSTSAKSRQNIVRVITTWWHATWCCITVGSCLQHRKTIACMEKPRLPRTLSISTVECYEL